MDKRYLKRAIKQNVVGRWVVNAKDSINNWWLYQRRKRYIPELTKLAGGG